MEEIKKIIVICGGSSSEREISLQSGKGVYDALKKLGYETTIVDFKTISDFNIFKTYDLIFIALHGFEGEGGNLQEKFDGGFALVQTAQLVPNAPHCRACVSHD